MNKTLRAVALALVAVFGVATGAQAQLAFSAEVRGDFSFPTDDLDDTYEWGAGFTGDLYLDFHETFSAYGGYNWTQFGCDDGSTLCTEDASTSGFELGLKAKLPVAQQFGPWVRGGVIFHELDLGEGIDADRETGFQVGLGLDIPLGMVVSVTPALHYSSYGLGEVNFGGTTEDADADITWWSAGVGLRFTFGR